MRRLSSNLVTMAAMVTDFEPTYPSRRISGKFLDREGELSHKDKPPARLNSSALRTNVDNMKAVVPCIVLGSTALSTAIIVVVSVLLLA